MRKLKLIVSAFLFTSSLAFVAAGSPIVSAADASDSAKTAICEGVNLGGSGGCGTGNPEGSINNIIKTVISFLSWIVGIISVIMIIIGGFKYIISSGDSANVTSAKNTILYAIIGLVIVAFAQIIVRFVLNTAV